MRIAILCCEPDPGGVATGADTRLRGLAAALARAGHDLTWLAPGEDGAGDDIPHRRLRQPVSAREIDWHYSHVAPELVIERLVPGCVEGAQAASEAGIPHVYDVPEDFDADVLASSPSIRGGLPEAFALASAAIVSREGLGARVKRLARASLPVLVVPDGVPPACFASPDADDLEHLARALRLAAGAPHIGFYGDLDAGCGVIPTIDAVAMLATGEPAQLVVAGDGPERNAALARAHASHVGLVLCGGAARRSVAAHLSLCTIVVVAGPRERRSPLALLEAMALGRAIVVEDGDGVRAIVRDQRDALLVPAGDPEALAHALRALLADPALRRRLGAQARTAAREKHTWDQRAATLADRLGSARTDGASRGAPRWAANGEAHARAANRG